MISTYRKKCLNQILRCFLKTELIGSPWNLKLRQGFLLNMGSRMGFQRIHELSEIT